MCLIFLWGEGAVYTGVSSPLPFPAFIVRGYEKGLCRRLAKSLVLFAEREGFEPSVPVRVQRFSRPSQSSTLASFLNLIPCISPSSIFFFFSAIASPSRPFSSPIYYHALHTRPRLLCSGTVLILLLFLSNSFMPAFYKVLRLVPTAIDCRLFTGAYSSL